MYEKNKEDIVEILDWLSIQKCLPKVLSPDFIHTFLFCFDGNKEKTKEVLANYFYARQSIPEIFTGRDPCLKENIAAWKATCFVPLMGKQDGCRVFLGAFLDSNTCNFNNFSKQIFMCFDLLIKSNEWENGDRIMIISYDELKLHNLSTFTIYLTRKTVECEKENYLPGRLRAIHNVHIPPFMRKLHERFQPFLGPDYEKIIHFHKTLRSLYRYINPEILPMEYGGNAGPLRVIKDKWYELMKANRNFFLEEEEKRMRETKNRSHSVEKIVYGR